MDRTLRPPDVSYFPFPSYLGPELLTVAWLPTLVKIQQHHNTRQTVLQTSPHPRPLILPCVL